MKLQGNHTEKNSFKTEELEESGMNTAGQASMFLLRVRRQMFLRLAPMHQYCNLKFVTS